MFFYIQKSEDLKDSTGLPQRYLTDILNQLLKIGLITKKNGKFIPSQFKTSKSMIKLPQLTVLVAKQKKEAIIEDVFQGRKENTRTAIVCVLKKWNELTYESLYDETKQMTRFLLSEHDFINSLDELIATDLVVKGKNGKYRYLT